MVRVLACLFLLFVGLSSGQSQNLGFSLADDRKKVQVPIEIHNNLIVVRVVLNDVIPLKFILDTGVRTAILTQKSFSDILQLNYSRNYSISVPGEDKVINAFVTNNVSLTLPGVNGRGHALLVLEEDYLELRNYLGTDVHGILGYELFSRFIVKIDYHRKVMTLMMPEKFKPGRGYDVIPIRIQDTKPYMLAPISINDTHSLNAKLLIDTGASHGLLLDQETDNRIVIPEKTVENVIGRGLGGEIKGRTGRIKSIEIGRFMIEKSLANFPNPDSYTTDTLKTAVADRNGTLGGDLLSRFHVIFNFPEEKFYFKKNADFKKQFYFNLSGLNVRAKGAQLNVFEIADVRAKSAGDNAGLKAGDLIVNINGIPAKDLRLYQINGLLNSKPGRRVKLDVKRDNQSLNYIFHLQDEI